MAQNIIIYIGVYKFLGVIGTLLVLTWYASHRFTRVEVKVDAIETRVGNLEDSLKSMLSK